MKKELRAVEAKCRLVHFTKKDVTSTKLNKKRIVSKRKRSDQNIVKDSGCLIDDCGEGPPPKTCRITDEITTDLSSSKDPSGHKIGKIEVETIKGQERTKLKKNLRNEREMEDSLGNKEETSDIVECGYEHISQATTFHDDRIFAIEFKWARDEGAMNLERSVLSLAMENNKQSDLECRIGKRTCRQLISNEVENSIETQKLCDNMELKKLKNILDIEPTWDSFGVASQERSENELNVPEVDVRMTIPNEIKRLSFEDGDEGTKLLTSHNTVHNQQVHRTERHNRLFTKSSSLLVRSDPFLDSKQGNSLKEQITKYVNLKTSKKNKT
ncbi:hypothetical protein SNEBB_000344 [Seison nebaliae]|nr:hypothetical protein SNEBB_000344 [Seison nebaliae]